MKNKKVFFGSLVATCLVLIVGVILFFAGLFTTKTVEYQGVNDVYLEYVWTSSAVYGGTTSEYIYIYETKIELDVNDKVSLINKKSFEREKVVEDFVEFISEEIYTQVEDKGLKYNLSSDVTLTNLVINEFSLANTSGIREYPATYGMDDFYEFDDSSEEPMTYGELVAFDREGTIDVFNGEYIYIEDVDLGNPSDIQDCGVGDIVDYNGMETVEKYATDYIHSNITDPSFIGQIIELTIGIIFIIISLVGLVFVSVKGPKKEKETKQ